MLVAYTGYNDIGGIVGRMSGSALIQVSSSLADTKNSGTVTGVLSVGGIAGTVQGNAIASGHSSSYLTNSGAVYGYAYVGGIVGYLARVVGTDGDDNSYAIQNATNTGKIYCTGNYGGYPYTTTIKVINSYVFYLSGTSYIAGVGGIVGYSAYGRIRNVTNSGDVSATFSSPDLSLSIDGISVYISNAMLGFGGIVGWINSTTDIEDASVRACTIGTDSCGIAFVGSVAGYVNPPTASYCGIECSITSSVTVAGACFVSTLVGAFNGTTTEASNRLSITGTDYVSIDSVLPNKYKNYYLNYTNVSDILIIV